MASGRNASLMGPQVQFPMPDSSPSPRPLRSVCVYCGSSESTRASYHDLATRMGQALAARGLRLIYGGGWGEGSTGDSCRASVERVRSFLSGLPAAEQAKVLGGNAAKLFGFVSS